MGWQKTPNKTGRKGKHKKVQSSSGLKILRSWGTFQEKKEKRGSGKKKRGGAHRWANGRHKKKKNEILGD